MTEKYVNSSVNDVIFSTNLQFDEIFGGIDVILLWRVVLKMNYRCINTTFWQFCKLDFQAYSSYGNQRDDIITIYLGPWVASKIPSLSPQASGFALSPWSV